MHWRSFASFYSINFDELFQIHVLDSLTLVFFSQIVSALTLLDRLRVSNSLYPYIYWTGVFYQIFTVVYFSGCFFCRIFIALNQYKQFIARLSLSARQFISLCIMLDSYRKILTPLLKDGLPCLFHSFRNKYFNKISLGNMLYFQNKL